MHIKSQPHFSLATITGAAWLRHTQKGFTLIGSKTDIIVVDMVLLRQLLTHAQVQLLLGQEPPTELLPLVTDAIVMVYECKTTKRLGTGALIVCEHDQYTCTWLCCLSLCNARYWMLVT